MIQSMTGYGRAENALKEITLCVELRAVNHRHASVVIRLPRLLAAQEETLKKALQNRFERGRIDLSVSLSGSGAFEKKLVLNLEAAANYHKMLTTLKKSLGLSGEIDVALMSQFRDVITTKEVSAPSPELETLLNQTFSRAMTALEKMRRHEGKALVNDLKTRLQNISKLLTTVKKQEKDVTRSRQIALKTRIAKLTGGIEVDPVR
ncbi:MAG: YicC/YloC family endoribonuclease, partial [Nitrospirota bacterium]|nr:YicC/YloC family endoribonuclease [Nitrospirota bacterium]